VLSGHCKAVKCYMALKQNVNIIIKVRPIWTSDISKIGTKLNIKESVVLVCRCRCPEKINVKNCNVIFALITLK